MHRIKVLLDLDDVCCDLISPWLKWHNDQCLNQLTKADVTDWDMNKSCSCNLNMYDYLKIPGVFRNLKLFPGVSNTIHELLWFYEFIVVTARPEQHHLDTSIWIAENLPYINDVYFTDEKWEVEGDIIVDDKPSTLLNCKLHDKITITMSWPYNQHVLGYRVNDWLELNHVLWSIARYG